MAVEVAVAAATAAMPTKRLTDEEFADRFDERYETRNIGDNIILLQEFDKDVYVQTGYGVPSLKHSESTLTRSRLPLYKVNVNDVKTESGLVREEIRPGVYGRVPIALRRVGIKHEDVIAAKFLSLNKSLILANGNDFIGGYCSENNNSIRALNVSPSGEVVNVSSDYESSPVGIVFKYYPNTAVAAKKEDSEGVIIPRGGSVEVELEEYPYNENGNGSEVKGPCLFSNSNGSCCLPEGVFFDKYVDKDGKVRFYNTDIKNDAQICLDEYDFLGYIQYLYDVEEKEEMEVEEEKEEEDGELTHSHSSSDATIIDLDALKVNDTVNLKAVVNVEGGIKISPYASVDVCMGRVKVIKGQEYDGPVCRLMRFPELVSVKNGLVLTQELLEEEEYETENLSITVFNVTNTDLIVQDGDVLVKALVAEACIVF